MPFGALIGAVAKAAVKKKAGQELVKKAAGKVAGKAGEKLVARKAGTIPDTGSNLSGPKKFEFKGLGSAKQFQSK